MSRLSTTARVGLMAVLLTLVAGWIPVAFLWRATHDDAIESLRRDTVEGARGLADAVRRDGRVAFNDAVARASAAEDPSLVVALVDDRGRKLAGIGPNRLALAPTADFRIDRVGTAGDWRVREAGISMYRWDGGWLVTGRLLDDWEAAQRRIERALMLSALASLILGVGGGALLTRYVTRRIDAVARTADAVAAGNLDRRVALPSGRHDAFDRLGARINAMLDRIERLVAELRLVTDSVAHDLRSPISRIRARAEVALAAKDEGQRDAALAGLVGETETITRMLTVLLEISRSQAGERTAFVLSDPGEIAVALADLYEPLLDEAGTRLVVDIPGTTSIALHRELVSQALANLIDNARNHAAGSGEVVLTVRNDANGVCLSVADHGPGIAPQDRAVALSRFGRLDAARSTHGAGLGLALVDAVARLHGGQLVLGDNDPGLIATMVLPHGG